MAKFASPAENATIGALHGWHFLPLISGMSTQTSFSDFRKNSGKTLDAVAEMFDVDRKTILRWEKGESPVPIKRLAEIAEATGLSKAQLRPDVFGSTERAS